MSDQSPISKRRTDEDSLERLSNELSLSWQSEELGESVAGGAADPCLYGRFDTVVTHS